MELLLSNGKLFAESLENAVRAVCIDEGIPYSMLENREQEVLNRCIKNTKVELSETAYNEIYTDVFYLLKNLDAGVSTGTIKEKIASIFVADQGEPSKLEEFFDKTDDTVDDVISAVEKGKEIYEKASPIVKLALFAIKKIPVFFK